MNKMHLTTLFAAAAHLSAHLRTGRSLSGVGQLGNDDLVHRRDMNRSAEDFVRESLLSDNFSADIQHLDNRHFVDPPSV